MKKIILFTLTLSLMSCSAKKQTISTKEVVKEEYPNSSETLPDETISEVSQLPVIMETIDKMPSFPGGNEAFYAFIAKNIKYPKEAKDNKVSGKVYAEFIVNENGRITDVKILRGIGSGCDEEAKRVLESMPNWEPKIVKGKPVKERMTVPVNFSLNK